jgi:hypothetical protein
LLAVVIAGCGDNGHGSMRTAEDASAVQPLSAVDARDLLERRLSNQAGFACALLPKVKTVKVVARDAGTLSAARRLVPRLLGGHGLQLTTDASAASFVKVERALLTLKGSAPSPMVANLGTTFHATRCPRVLVDIPRGHRLTHSDRTFLDDARTQYGGILQVRRITPPHLD